MKAILKGVRVVDFTTYVAAPTAGRILAEWGADVIKVESLDGDPFRYYGNKLEIPCTDEENPMWELFNQNKRSVALNLKTAGGKEAMMKLLETADVLLTNVRLASLKRLGLDYETLHEIFPKLIWAHVSGFGTEGPEGGRPGYDVVAYWSRGGFIRDQCPPGGTPINNPYGIGDITTSLGVLSGVLGGLMSRNNTGVGEKIQLSLLGMATWVNCQMLTSTQFGDVYPRDRYCTGIPLSGNYVCKDGEMITFHILAHEQYWEALCDALEIPEYKEDPRFSTADEAQKPENNVLLAHLLEDTFRTKDSTYWVPRLMEADLAFERCRHYSELCTDPQVLANRYVIPYKMRSGREFMITTNPIRIGEDDFESNFAPLLGEHTEEVLTSLGYTAEEIEKLREDKMAL